MTVHAARVAKFLRLCRHSLPEGIELPDADDREARARLIMQNAIKAAKALGFAAFVTGDRVSLSEMPQHGSLEEIARTAAELSVVNTGNLLLCGIDDEPVLEEIDKNNLAKFGPGHTIREDGKLVKPPNYRPPDIHRVLVAQGAELP